MPSGRASAGPRGLLRGTRTVRRAALARGAVGLARERGVRGGAAGLALERPGGGAGARGRFARGRAALAGRVMSLLVGKVHAGAPRLRQAYRDRLLRSLRSVLAFADVVHLFADELARLGARGLARALVAAGGFEGSL